MNKPKSAYFSTFVAGMIHSLEYRFEFLATIVSTLFPIVIQVYLWLAIYGGSNSDKLFGYNFAQMMVYVAVAGVVSNFVVTGIENVINDDIHSGALASFIIKPIRYAPLKLFQVLGNKFASIITLVIFTALTIIVLHLTLGFHIVVYGVLLFIPVLILGTLLNFFIFFILSMIAFWLTEVGRFFHAIQITIMVLSGGVFPISVLGDTYVAIMKFFPFIYTTYFPINVLTGTSSLEEIALGMIVQLVWVAIFWCISRGLWDRGLKKYVAVGG